MKNTLLAPMLALMALTGCSVPGDPGIKTPDLNESPAIYTAAVGYTGDIGEFMSGNVTENMLPLPKAELVCGDDTLSVVLYIDAELDSEGFIARDDGSLVSLIVHRGEGGFPLVKRQYIQGELAVYVVESYDGGGPEVITLYKSSSGLRIESYFYDAETDSFLSGLIYETTGNVSVHG